VIEKKEIDAYDEIGCAETLRLNLHSVAEHLRKKYQEQAAEKGNANAVRSNPNFEEKEHLHNKEQKGGYVIDNRMRSEYELNEIDRENHSEACSMMAQMIINIGETVIELLCVKPYAGSITAGLDIDNRQQSEKNGKEHNQKQYFVLIVKHIPPSILGKARFHFTIPFFLIISFAGTLTVSTPYLPSIRTIQKIHAKEYRQDKQDYRDGIPYIPNIKTKFNNCLLRYSVRID
jgi:hypothetical protein